MARTLPSFFAHINELKHAALLSFRRAARAVCWQIQLGSWNLFVELFESMCAVKERESE
jgi:hypothetical protein